MPLILMKCHMSIGNKCRYKCVFIITILCTTFPLFFFLSYCLGTCLYIPAFNTGFFQLFLLIKLVIEQQIQCTSCVHSAQKTLISGEIAFWLRKQYYVNRAFFLGTNQSENLMLYVLENSNYKPKCQSIKETPDWELLTIKVVQEMRKGKYFLILSKMCLKKAIENKLKFCSHECTCHVF